MASAEILRGAFLVVLGTFGVLAIQNDPTYAKSSQDATILSASAYTGPERTLSSLQRDEILNFRTSQATLNLESSRSPDNEKKDYEPFAFKVTSPDESIDVLTSSKHVDHFEGNNIEVKPGEYYSSIMPTKSDVLSGEGQGAPQGRDPSSEPRLPVDITQDQRDRPQDQSSMRKSRQEAPRIYNKNGQPIFPTLQTMSPGQNRQANPDIQDIITGIVKLLNGNVNVAANTARPHKPVQATRINNRGPPRITDLPPLPPDFDTPGMNPPPPPQPDHPYAFEKPPAPEKRPSINQLPPERPVRPYIHGVPLPESIVPQGNRPWNRPYRPGITRRPIPPYKPMPPHDMSFYDLESTEMEKPHRQPSQKPVPQSTSPNRETILKPNNSMTENTDNPNVKATTNQAASNKTNEETTKKPLKYKPPLKDEKIVAENTLILGSDPRPIPIPNHGVDEENSDEKSSLTSPRPVLPLESHFEFTKQPQEKLSKSTTTVKTMDETTMTTTTTTKKRKNEAEESASSTTKNRKISSTSSKTMTTLKIETSSSIQIIEPTRTITKMKPTVVTVKEDEDNSSINVTPMIASSSAIDLEPSRKHQEDKSSSSATETLPVNFVTSTSGIGKTTISYQTNPAGSFTKSHVPTERYSYRPRPGIVLDDTLDYTGNPGLTTQRPYAPPRHPQIGDIFDVTVSAIQGPGGGAGDSVRVPVNVAGSDFILTSAVEGQGFVSIDGKRTYVKLFDTTDQTGESTQVQQPQPTRTQAPPIVGTGYAIPQPADLPPSTPRPIGPPRRGPFVRRPTQPPVRIDTCIVGDTSTCDASQHEACATVQGVSACHCKPGYARLTHSLPCKRVVSIVVSIRVDRIYDTKVVWDDALSDKDSESYQTLAYESNKAIESAMTMTPFFDEYMGSSINSVYQGDLSQGQGGVFVNATLKLNYEPRTARPSLAGELQRHLLGVIHRRNNNIGNSAVYVDSPPGSISNLQDLDECASTELNDCHSSAKCSNTWGGFTCSCSPGFKDPHKDDPNEAGRSCLSCPSTHCNNRGTCSYQDNQMQCSCTGNYYGAQCEVDGEVLGVAIGASVAALVIIVLTLICLVMWSRRWSREQKTVGSPVYGYMQGGIPGTLPGTLARVGSVGTLASVKQGPPTNLPPYMWAHIADHMATANVYATEPMGPTRPSSAMFGYPTMSIHGTLPPVPLPRLQAPPRLRQRHHQPEPDSSDSEPQDKDRADLIPQSSGFHVPRPKSRSSLANQSGIYYDVEYDQGDAQHLSKNNIPMSTYSMARPYYRT